MTDLERWRRVEDLCDAALERDAGERATFVAAACGDDEGLRHEVEALLAHAHTAEEFLAAPMAAVAMDVLADEPRPSLAGQQLGAWEPGMTLGGYRVERLLGRGGMGLVFLAYDTRLHRRVALKVMDVAADRETSRTGLLREARSAAALNHSNICTIYEVGEASESAFIAMEYVEGRSLRNRLDEGPLSLDDVLRYARQAADALAFAHAHGVVHRDFKAANVIVTDAGRLKVIDFGLARRHDTMMASATTIASAVPTGAVAGTPYAMAPEQVRGDSSDARTDIWAFGILLYEMVSGAKPFIAATIPDLFSSILRDTPGPLPNTVPVPFRALIERCLEKDPERRVQRAEEVRAGLDAIQASTFDGELGKTFPFTLVSGRTRFVGREPERAELHRKLERAAGGYGGLVLVAGEPGIGKTRLVEETLSHARQRGFLTLTGCCYETAGMPPYIPYVEILEQWARAVPARALQETLGDAAPEVAKLMPEVRRLFPDTPPSLELPPEQQRRYLFNRFLEFMERGCAARPLVLVLDDLQWADEPTLLLLQHMAPRLPQIPMLLLGTYRDVELDVERPFAATLELLTRQRLAHRMVLKRLAEDDVREMLGALSGQAPPNALVRIINEETEGNPFFMEEVFHHLAEEGKLFDQHGRWRADLRIDTVDVPESVRLVIGRRLGRLSEEGRQVLTRAALVGRCVDLALL